MEQQAEIKTVVYMYPELCISVYTLLYYYELNDAQQEVETLYSAPFQLKFTHTQWFWARTTLKWILFESYAENAEWETFTKQLLLNLGATFKVQLKSYCLFIVCLLSAL